MNDGDLEFPQPGEYTSSIKIIDHILANYIVFEPDDKKTDEFEDQAKSMEEIKEKILTESKTKFLDPKTDVRKDLPNT